MDFATDVDASLSPAYDIIQHLHDYGCLYTSNAPPFPSSTIGLSGSSQRTAQFGGQPLNLQWQHHVSNFYQQHEYGSCFAANAWPFPSSTIGLSASSPRTAAASEPLGRHPNRFVNDSSGHRFYYSRDLKRQFCLFRRKWMSARTDGTSREPWRKALDAFFRSEIDFFQVGKSTDKVTRKWWNNRHKYLTEEELSTCHGVDPGSSGDGGFRESAGNVGIGSECMDSTSGGWDDCMGDAATRHEAPAQVQAQSQSVESPSSVAARVADAASAEAAAVDAASVHESPAAEAATAEGKLAPAATTTGAVP
jgi:hypothetical protein